MKRRTAIRVISFLSAGVVALGATAWFHYSRAEQYKRFTEIGYQRAFSELCTSMRELDTALQKSVYALSPAATTTVCTEIYGKAMTAQMSLGVLPFSTQELEQTAAFLSRVGDYASMLSHKAAAGGYVGEERDNLRSLSGTATVLAQNLLQLQTEMAEGALSMDEMQRMQKSADAAEEQLPQKTVGGSMKLMEQEFPEVPTLIYDGPFSEHLMNPDPRLIRNAGEIGEDLAKKTAAAFLGMGLADVKSIERCDGSIPCWRICAGAQYCISVSKRGGEVLSVICSRQPGQAVLDAKAGVSAARRFLESHGYKNMAESYHIIQENVITVNFVYSLNGVLCYPDMIKVGIALDDGSLMSFDAMGYVSSHYERSLPPVKVSADEARRLVADELKILSESLAVIPTGGKYELFCHEFKCEAPDGRRYILYVNAETGQQEKILVLLEDENGSLTL